MAHPRTFEEFWPYYVGEHRRPATRALHFVGTHLGLLCVPLAFVTSPWMLAGLPVLGYGFAWIGHFFVERNRPATFTYPLWSLRGDIRMLRLTWAGKMDDEVRRLGPAPQSP